MQFVFYRASDEYVICLSDVKKEDREATRRMRKELGTYVPGELIAPFAQRSLSGNLTYSEFRRLMNQGCDIPIEWFQEGTG